MLFKNLRWFRNVQKSCTPKIFPVYALNGILILLKIHSKLFFALKLIVYLINTETVTKCQCKPKPYFVCFALYTIGAETHLKSDVYKTTPFFQLKINYLLGTVKVVFSIGKHLRLDNGDNAVGLADGGIPSKNIGILDDGLRTVLNLKQLLRFVKIC